LLSLTGLPIAIGRTSRIFESEKNIKYLCATPANHRMILMEEQCRPLNLVRTASQYYMR
jgi:hypothetical protein